MQIQNLNDIPLMLKCFQHLSFSITRRSWHEVMNECESTSLIFIRPRFKDDNYRISEEANGLTFFRNDIFSIYGSTSRLLVGVAASGRELDPHA